MKNHEKMEQVLKKIKKIKKSLIKEGRKPSKERSQNNVVVAKEFQLIK